MSLIRLKSIKTYPNGGIWANYHLEDIPQQEWYPAIVELISLIKRDSRKGWPLIFQNLLSSLKASVFYPVMTSFSDRDADYSINRGVKFAYQQTVIFDYFVGKDKELLQDAMKDPLYPYHKKYMTKEGAIVQEAMKHTKGREIYPSRNGKGSRWLFDQQMKRVSGYSNEKLLEMLHEFSTIGRAIPTSGWEYNYTYGKKIKAFCEDYSEYLKIAYLLPPSWHLMDKIKPRSWLKLLINAGILSESGDLLRAGRGVRCIAKDGHECNSLVELDIDNWLYLNNISHEKEPLYPYHEKYNPNARLRADFRTSQFFIEYAGLLDDPKYVRKMKRKEALARELNVKLIVITPKDLQDLDSVLEVLKDI